MEYPMQLNPYLNFQGLCKAAFSFYEKVLDGKIEAMISHGETPAAEHVPPDWQDAIIHARLVFGDNVLMGSDAPPDRYEDPKGLYLSLHIPDSKEGERVFKALADGGTVTMPFEKTFWAERFGMLVDRFGIPWMINCEPAA
jgi:PhnB protein